MICGRGLFNDMRRYINKQRLLPVGYCIHYRYRLVFIICMCPPLIYIAMDIIMCYLFSLRVFKLMGAHTHVHQAFIHYFQHSLASSASSLKTSTLFLLNLTTSFCHAIQLLSELPYASGRRPHQETFVFAEFGLLGM